MLSSYPQFRHKIKILEAAVDTEFYEGDFDFAKTVGGVQVRMERTEYESLRRIDEPGNTLFYRYIYKNFCRNRNNRFQANVLS